MIADQRMGVQSSGVSGKLDKRALGREWVVVATMRVFGSTHRLTERDTERKHRHETMANTSFAVFFLQLIYRFPFARPTHGTQTSELYRFQKNELILTKNVQFIPQNLLFLSFGLDESMLFH